MTVLPMPPLLPVTQADRDLATAIVSHIRGYGVKLPNDKHFAIQEVARHRLAHSSHGGEELREAHDRLVEAADFLIDRYQHLWSGKVVRDLAEAEAGYDVAKDCARAALASPPPVDRGEAAYPMHIGRLHLGERRSDGERLCSHSHAVAKGHPLYWPERLGEYPDDVDPLCLEHAIEQAVDDNGWCEKCTGAEFAAQPLEGLTSGVEINDDTPCVCCCRSKGEHNTKGQCPETSYFVANVPRRPSNHAGRVGEVQ